MRGDSPRARHPRLGSIGSGRGAPGGLGESGATPFEELGLASWRLYPRIVEELQTQTGSTSSTSRVGRSIRSSRPRTSTARRPARRRAEARTRHRGVGRGRSPDREPALSTRVRGAMYVKGDHWVNNQRLVVAYAAAARGRGCGWHRGRREPHRRGGRPRTRRGGDGERVDADVVLLAARAWTDGLVESFGSSLPRSPGEGRCSPSRRCPPSCATVSTPTTSTSCPARRASCSWAPPSSASGSSAIGHGPGHRRLAIGARSWCRARRLPISRTWFGFRPWAPDSLPHPRPLAAGFGASAWRRLTIATGSCSPPITARLMADWIARGGTVRRLAAFMPDRVIRR